MEDIKLEDNGKIIPIYIDTTLSPNLNNTTLARVLASQ